MLSTTTRTISLIARSARSTSSLLCTRSHPISRSFTSTMAIADHANMAPTNGHASHASTSKPLSRETINPAVLNVEYAVRGELALKADKYAQQLGTSNGQKANLPFDKVVTANIGNPQQRGLDQQPITFWRQVVSLCEYPDLMTKHKELAEQIYPKDVIERASRLIEEIGSTGAYTHSKGVLGIRKNVARYIEERDGHPSDPEEIYLTAGASAGVSLLLGVLLKAGDGVMIPIPQYPLYTATLAYASATPLPYYLDESAGWSMSLSSLHDTIASARSSSTPIKALVIINPGNPTGGCLSYSDMQKVVQLCHDEGILLMADEVYQANIFQPDTKPFVSFKKVVREMETKEVREGTQLVSFHSISKGVSGECGRRGGYFELVNIAPEVQEQIYKMASIALCPPVTGQIGVDLLVSPPKPSDPSYAQFKAETSKTHENLKSRSEIMGERFNALEGMSCQPAEGAMYLFPKIDMPQKALAEAEKRGKPADVMYALDLLDATGICAVAGSGFGQEPNTYHLRVTALCPGVEDYIGKIEAFHKDFMAKYRD